MDKVEEIRLGDVFRMLWRGKVIILAAMAVGAALAVFRAQTAVPQYKALSRFIVKSKSSAVNPQLAGLASLIGGGKAPTLEADPSLFFPYIVTDDVFLGKLLSRKWLIGGDSAGLDVLLPVKVDSSKPDWAYRYERKRVAALRDSRMFRLSKEANNLLVLETYVPDPRLTYDLNQYIVELLDDYVVNKLLIKARENRKFIEDRVLEAQEDLKRSEDHIVQFRQSNFDVRAPKVYMEMVRLEQKVTINREIYLQLRKELELAKIDEYKDQPLVEIINAPQIPVDRDSPKKKQMVALGLLAGFVLGCALAVVTGFLPRSRRRGAPATA